MAIMNLLSYKLENSFSDHRSELNGRFVFLLELMAISHRQATKHYFLMTQALATCCGRLAGQNTYSFAEIMDFSIFQG